MWISIIISCCTTIAGLLIADIYTNIKKAGKKAADKRQAENIEIIKEIIYPQMQTIDAKLTELASKSEETDKLLKDATKAQLRNTLMRFGDKAIIKGYLTRNEREDWEKLFSAYKAIGGNTFIIEMNERVEALPTDTEYFREKNKEFSDPAH